MPFRIELGKAGSLVSWFASFFFFFKVESLQQWWWSAFALDKVLLALAASTSLSAKNEVVVFIPFVKPNHGEGSYKGETCKLCLQSFRVAHCSHVTLRIFLFSIIVFLFLIMLPWYF